MSWEIWVLPHPTPKFCARGLAAEQTWPLQARPELQEELQVLRGHGPDDAAVRAGPADKHTLEYTEKVQQALPSTLKKHLRYT